ncbi:MAG: clan AA aspartic protease [Deltaproteobacteria bacterium]|nr:clan AA aspartic protease [Deltaproteobacteria bacterium]
MITGHVVAASTALIPIHFPNTQGQEDPIEAIIDTGFTGFLTLPLPQIAKLGFPYQGLIDARLGNGSAAEFDMFAGAVLWDGQLRTGIVLAVEGTPLVGMALLRGSRVTLDVEDGGLVTIEPLP